MRLYVDDDTASALLVQLLRRAGHDVRVPADLGAAGAKDSLHFRYAIREGRVLLSRNYDDFEQLHFLVIESGGHHPGVLVIRQDNDPKRNLSPPGVVRALRNIEAAGVSLADTYQVLNHWR